MQRVSLRHGCSSVSLRKGGGAQPACCLEGGWRSRRSNWGGKVITALDYGEQKTSLKEGNGALNISTGSLCEVGASLI